MFTLEVYFGIPENVLSSSKSYILILHDTLADMEILLKCVLKMRMYLKYDTFILSDWNLIFLNLRLCCLNGC